MDALILIAIATGAAVVAIIWALVVSERRRTQAYNDYLHENYLHNEYLARKWRRRGK